MTKDDLDAEVAALLSEFDQRYTAGRKRLVSTLSAGSGPLTISEILAADTTQAQSSVYRNLTILESVGAVTRIVTSDEFARYELAERFTEHHHHLICSSCGSVEDFSLDASVETMLDDALHSSADRSGFKVREHRLDLLGVCMNCT